MKKIVIGRGLDCDIVINDVRDDVSRHHAVISFDILGRMKLSDTSSNGTFINDEKMLKGTSIRVTRNDKIRLADYWVLDWAMIRDPYIIHRKVLIGVCAVVLTCLLGWGGWSVAKELLGGDEPEPVKKETSQEPTQDDATWNADSTYKVAPKAETTAGKKPAAKKEAKREGKAKRNPGNKGRSTNHSNGKSSMADPDDVPDINIVN